MRKREKEFLTLVNDTTGSFYSTSGNQTNHITGSGGLAAGSLSSAKTTMRNSKTPDGEPVFQMPDVLLTSVTDEDTADDLVNRENVVIHDSSGTVPAGLRRTADKFQTFAV